MEMERVKTVFEENHFGFEDEGPLHRCTILLQDYFQSPLELVEAYEIFTIQKGLRTKVITENTLSKFETFHRKTTGFAGRIQASPCSMDELTSPMSTSPSRKQEFSTPIKGSTNRRVTGRTTPSAYRSPTASLFLNSGRSFSERKKKGHTFISFNDHLAIDANDRSKENLLPVLIELLSRQITTETKLLHDRLDLKVRYINNRITDFMDAVEQFYKVDCRTSLNQLTQEALWFCGMVCCDSDGRLNPQSMMLLGSQTFSNGLSIRLDISQLTNYSLFPGQIIAVKARNPTGRCLIVEDVICHLPPAEMKPLLEVEEMAIFVASGPFSSSEDLGYGGLSEILHLCEIQTFDVVILMGPFVSIQQPVCHQTDFELTFEDIYQQMVIPVLMKIEALCGRLVIIPSTDDAHVLPVFPQPPFPTHPDLTNTFHFQNPCVLKLGNLVLGVCTHDIVKSISMSVCEHFETKPDRVGFLLKHLIGQRSFHPLFPGLVGTCLDASLAPCLEIPTSLDILICPSVLQTFVKVICEENRDNGGGKHCICVNPGKAVRGNNGGYYAIINVLQNSMNPHDSVRVDIIGI